MRKTFETLGDGGGGTCAAVRLKGVGANAKVSASTDVPNICVSQRGRGDVVCVRGDIGETEERRDPDGVASLSVRHRDERG